MIVCPSPERGQAKTLAALETDSDVSAVFCTATVAETDGIIRMSTFRYTSGLAREMGLVQIATT